MRRLPLYVRVVSLLLLVWGLSQTGFALLNLHNTFTFAIGGLCLLSAPYIAFVGGRAIYREITSQ